MKFRNFTPFIIITFFIAMMIQVGCDTLITENTEITLVDSTLAIACFDCHTDENNLLLRPKGQFRASAHANPALLDLIDPSCEKCHTHEGFLKDIDSVINSYEATSAITCFTCHLPHTGEYATWDIDTIRTSSKLARLVNGSEAQFGVSNSCAHCHSATALVPSGENIVLDDAFGPHVSPQADITSGKNAYFLNVVNTTPNTANIHFTNGCVKCHYGGFGEGQGYAFAEHTFRLEDKNSLQQFKETCNVSGCHIEGATGADALITDFYASAKIAEIDSLAGVVKSHLSQFEIIDNSDSSGLTYTVGDTITRIQAEAYYNYLLYKNDRSRGIHNINFVVDLLDTTINVLDSLPAIPSISIANPTACFGDSVFFTPNILGTFDTLHWDFGNGIFVTTSSDTAISSIYNTPGTYSVSLSTVSLWTLDSLSDAGTDTIFATLATSESVLLSDTIIIDGVPVSNFSIDIDTVCVNENVTFTSEAVSLLPAMMIWDFGDNDSAFIPVATHAYTTAGTYSVSLNVTTDCGTDDTLMQNLITVLAGPTAAFTFTTTDSLTFNFTDASIGVIDSSWSWEFLEDGARVGIDSVQNPIFTYTGNVLVLQNAILTVMNSNGCFDVDTMVVPRR